MAGFWDACGGDCATFEIISFAVNVIGMVKPGLKQALTATRLALNMFSLLVIWWRLLLRTKAPFWILLRSAFDGEYFI